MQYNNIETKLTKMFEKAFEKLGFEKEYAEVTVSDRPDLCQFQCNGALQLARTLKKNPFEIAETIKAKVEPLGKTLFKSIKVCKPGFVNIIVKDKVIADKANELIADERIGCPKFVDGKKAFIDYGGPNVAKSLHVGHLRSGVFGQCVYNLMKFCGYDVVGDVHLGDWGTQMGMLIEAVRKEQPELPYFDEDYQEDYPTEPPITVKDLERLYPEASALCKENEEEAKKARAATKELQHGRRGYVALWQHFINVSIPAIREDYKKLNVEFDLWKGESDVQYMIPQMIDDLIKRGVAEESEGALVVRVPDMNGQEVPPMIVRKSDGGAIYATTDLATIKERVEKYGAQEVIYTTDQRQLLHFYQVFESAKKAGYADDVKLEFLGFGTVNGKDGKPFKTRSGGTARLNELIKMVKDAVEKRLNEVQDESKKVTEKFSREDLINQISVAVIKFADLINNRVSGYIFDIDKFSSFDGKTGPYLLYSAVRIKSILRKAQKLGIKDGKIGNISTEYERDLLLYIDQLPQVLCKALEKKELHYICEFAFNLCQKFSKFYTECSILNEKSESLKKSRLSISILTLQTIELVFKILGIEAPERM